ncbi:MAG: DnaJ domain-containing protein [Succinivibrionaceae bacterium]|nr:DnaJ domain-containing protein [Succinivibrionaceae bacterium]
MADEKAPQSCCCGCITLYILAAIATFVAELFRSPLAGTVVFIALFVGLMILGSFSGGNSSSSGGDRGDAGAEDRGGYDPGGAGYDPGGAGYDPGGAGYGPGAAGTDENDDIRAMFMPMGFVIKHSSCSLNMQYIFLDEAIEKFELSPQQAMMAHDFARAGFHASRQEIRRVVASIPRVFPDSDHENRVKIFVAQITVLFYDDVLTPDEISLFYEMGSWHGLGRSELESIFAGLVQDFGLFYDHFRGCYRSQSSEYSDEAWRSSGWDRGRGGREDSSGGYRRESGGGSSGGYRQGGSSAGGGSGTLREAYITLGVDPGASDADVKKAYRRLMSKYHPDRAIAQGLGSNGVKKFTELSQTIQAAWETVKRNRGIT